MTKLPVLSGEEVIKALAMLGFFVARQKGSHIILRRDDPSGMVVVPNHKSWIEARLEALFVRLD